MISAADYRAAYARVIAEFDLWYSRDIMFDDYATETFETVVWC